MNRVDALPRPPFAEVTTTAASAGVADFAQSAKGSRALGAILIDAGRLSLADAESILRFQRQRGSRFGEAALELGLLSREDIRFALARQFEYPCLPPDDTSLDRKLIAAFRPDAMIVEQLRGLRSQLMLRWFDTEADSKSLAVVSPGQGDGRSFLAANLAIVFSQLGERTLLIDADLREPVQHALFRTGKSPGLSAVLAGRAGHEAIVRIPALRGLSVLPAGALPPNPQELLGQARFGELLKSTSRQYDVILIDTPAADSCADALTVAARSGGALLIARKDRSAFAGVKALTRDLQTVCHLVGSALNDVRA